MDPELKQLLNQYKTFFRIEDNGKITCTLNGHGMPPRLDIFSAFVNGAKFQRIKKEYEAQNNLSKYEPFIVKSRNFEHMLFCALTGQHIDKSVQAVKKHMQGKKFQRAKERFMKDQQPLRVERFVGKDGRTVQDEVRRSAAADAACLMLWQVSLQWQCVTCA